MTAEELERIPELFAQALEQSPETRTEFLRQACDNEELFRAVTALIASHDDSESFLEVSAIREAAQLISAEPQPPEGRLGRFQILAPLGRGGMGEVYLARDDLDREVAIKILPDLFAQSPERVARFEREARTLAQLNHPNIAVIYGREESDNIRFLILEYVRGETLAARLQRGPLPVDEALPVFTQIADALAATHEAGIIHRDLKPANIMLTPKGQVKLLDFGIARHFRRDPTPVQDTAAQPVSDTLTHPGVTPGTVAYMSPEQFSEPGAGATEDDARAIDLWAFGLVLYEALTGVHPFRGKTSDETGRAICEREPDFERLPKGLPTPLRKLLRQCLTKNPQQRLRDAGEARHRLAAAAKYLRFSPRFRLTVTAAAALLIVSFGWLAWSGLAQRGTAVQTRLAVVAWQEQPETAGCQFERSQALARMLEDRLREIRGVQVAQAAENTSLKLLMADLSRAQAARTQGADTVLLVAADCVAQHRLRYSLVNRQGEQLAAGEENDFRQLLVNVLGALRLKAEVPNSQLSESDQLYYQALVALDQYASASAISEAVRILEELRTKDQTNSVRLNAALGLAYYRQYALTGEPRLLNQATAACDQVAGSSSPDALLRCALVLTGTGHPERAIASYNQVLQQHPNDPEALLGLAQAYEHLPDASRAEEYYQRAIALRPDYWAGYNELGGFYYEQQRYDKAVECWLRVTELLPLNPYGLNNLASALLYQGRFAEAQFYYQQSIRQQPVAEAFQGLGLTLIYKGSCNEAVSVLERATQLEPNDAELRGWLGDALHCAGGRKREAEAAWDSAIRLIRERLSADPQNAPAQALLAEWLAKRGRNVQAMAQIEQALAVAPDDPFSTATGVRVFYLTGRKERALALLPAAARNRNSLFDLEHAPELAGLRADPAWQSIVKAEEKQQGK
ncbi:MAG TPA: protein kinase [Blastocatellia bacterium]|nr:protein kinase [Blastocatellia bacterium]